MVAMVMDTVSVQLHVYNVALASHMPHSTQEVVH